MDLLIPSVPVLLVLRALEEGPVHGYAIARWVDAHSDGLLHLKEGTLYPLLRQLEQQGLISGQWEKTGTGRPTKVYALTEPGRKRLAEDRASWSAKSVAVNRLLQGLGQEWKDGAYGLV